MKKFSVFITLLTVLMMMFCGCEAENSTSGETLPTSKNVTVTDDSSVESSVNDEVSQEATTTQTSEENTTAKNNVTQQTPSNTVENSSTQSKSSVASQIQTSSAVNHPKTTGDTVYYTPTGKRYHRDPDCGGKNSTPIDINDAVNRGLTPCQKCAQ